MAFRRVFAVFGAVALLLSVSATSYGQDKDSPERKKLSKDELVQYDALNALVNNVVAGKQPAPADVKLTFHNHFLKSNANLYMPYSVDVEPGKFTAPVAMYVRAVSKNPAPAAAAAPAGRGGRGGRGGGNASPNAPAYPFEDIYFLPPITDVVNRAMELPAGDYDLHIAMTEKPKDKKTPAKAVVTTQSLSVPATGTALTTSSVILAKNIEAAAAKLSPQEQLEQPYTMSGYKITPRFTSSIPKAEDLIFVFFIYNEGVAASGKPDLDVDYMFYRAAEEKPFSKLATTSFNATTLPGEFDAAAGHQVFVGQGIPLTTFTPGDYKLELKISDKTNSSTVTRNVPFTVTP